MAIFLFLLLLTFSINSEAENPVAPVTMLVPLPNEAPLAKFIEQMLVHHDFQSTSINQAMSERIVDRYLSALDPQKLYFSEKDIELFSGDRSVLGSEIDEEDLHLPFAIFSLYQRRVLERYTFSRTLLNRNFKFSSDENYDGNREKGPRVKSETDLHDLWRKLVKNDWLVQKIRGKTSEDIRAKLDKRYLELMNRALKYRSEDVFQIFMDAFANAVEPHTDYLGNKAAEEFDIEMKLSMVGIGAEFQQIGDYLVISDLSPGGPAALSGKLHIGDRLVGVGQGEEGALINVIGARIDDVATLVRGPKGSSVKLALVNGDVDRADGTHTVTLVRNKIVFAEAAAKKSIIQIDDGRSARKIGVITLPIFYQDFDARKRGEQDYKSATRDVSQLLTELASDKVDGILIDLRNNGGGALDEAVGLAGLFIGKGPVVQEIDTKGRVSISSSDNMSPIWNGPLAVLINRRTASASEIFAAAMQDYGRGIIVGETSFGKGTVQTIVNLDKLLKSDHPEFGELKLTIAQFFRVNGESTQLRGVTPDIAFPSSANSENFSESKFDNAVPWAMINPVSFERSAQLSDLIPELQTSHALRVAKDPDFRKLQANAETLTVQRDRHAISLNETIRRNERVLENSGNASGISMPGTATKLTGVEKLDRSGGLTDLSAVIAARGEEAIPPEKSVEDSWLMETAHILCDQSVLYEKSEIKKY